MNVDVRRRADGALSFLRAVFREVREEDVTFMAGSIAYAAFLSLFPVLLLAMVIAATVGGPALADSVLALTSRYLTASAQRVVGDAFIRPEGLGGFSLLGLAALLWSVLKVFRGLDTAFSKLYKTPRKNSIVDQLKDGLVVLAGVGLALLVMLAVGALFAFAPPVPFVGVLSGLFLVVGLAVAFLPIYYVFPDVDVTLREVLPGTVVAAVGWTVLQTLFQVYVSLSSSSEVYGAIGGVILLVTWLYFASVVLLLGGATNVVLAGRQNAGVEPSDRAANGERTGGRDASA